jgi:hypothetical protein
MHPPSGPWPVWYPPPIVSCPGTLALCRTTPVPGQLCGGLVRRRRLLSPRGRTTAKAPAQLIRIAFRRQNLGDLSTAPPKSAFPCRALRRRGGAANASCLDAQDPRGWVPLVDFTTLSMTGVSGPLLFRTHTVSQSPWSPSWSTRSKMSARTNSAFVRTCVSSLTGRAFERLPNHVFVGLTPASLEGSTRQIIQCCLSTSRGVTVPKVPDL